MNRQMILAGLCLLLLAVPMAQAQAQTSQTFIVQGGLGSSTEVTSYHTYPQHPIPSTGSFYVNVNLFSDDDDWNVEVVFFELHGGCVESHRHTNTTTPQSYSLSVLVDMAGSTACSWHYIGKVYDPQANVRHEFHEVGTLPSFSVHDLGQDASASASTYGAWLLVFGILAAFAFIYGAGWLWAAPIATSIGGIVSLAYPVFPVQPIGFLYLYLICLAIIWWITRIKESKTPGSVKP